MASDPEISAHFVTRAVRDVICPSAHVVWRHVQSGRRGVGGAAVGGVERVTRRFGSLLAFGRDAVQMRLSRFYIITEESRTAEEEDDGFVILYPDSFQSLNIAG